MVETDFNVSICWLVFRLGNLVPNVLSGIINRTIFLKNGYFVLNFYMAFSITSEHSVVLW